jgi:hypothetical protein
MEFVTMVITEVGMIPATSVPVVLREYHKDHLMVDEKTGAISGIDARDSRSNDDEKYDSRSSSTTSGGGTSILAPGGPRPSITSSASSLSSSTPSNTSSRR